MFLTGDHQRKFDGLQRWLFHSIIKTFPVMLHITLLLLACGLCRYMLTINTPVACTLITLTSLRVLFYVVVVICQKKPQPNYNQKDRFQL